MPPATQQQASQMPALPFTASAHEHYELAFTRTITPGASRVTLDPIDIPATGYLRSVILDVEAVGGVGGTLSVDGPYNLFSSIALHDVNGGKIIGPIDGFGLAMMNLAGGYSYASDPGDSPEYLQTVNPSFMLRIPVEISRKNGFGSLANQSTASQYQLDLTIAAIAELFSVVGGTPPAITIRGWVSAWTVPALTNAKGQLQSQAPPMLGSSQMVTSTIKSGVIVGDNTIRLTRLGNYIRSLVFIARNAAGVRTDGVFPNPFTFDWDGVSLTKENQRLNHFRIREKSAGPSPMNYAGVFILPFNHGGPTSYLGNEDPDLWLPSSATARMEINGTSTVAGSIQVITNDVTVVESNPVERYQVPNETGQLVNA